MKQKSAIIPYKITDSGIQVLLIQNASHTKWVIPKGTIEFPLRAHISATKEAFEEAGVLGFPHPIIVGKYFKNEQYVPTFLLEVDLELEDYEEEYKRIRKWVHKEEVRYYVTDEDLVATILNGIKSVEKNGNYFKNAIKTFCENSEITILKIGNKRATLTFQPEEGLLQTVKVKRFKSTIEFSVISHRLFASLEEIPSLLLSTLLLENGENSIGFWAILKKEDQYRLTRMYNQNLKLLDKDQFLMILRTLATQCDCFEQKMKKKPTVTN